MITYYANPATLGPPEQGCRPHSASSQLLLSAEYATKALSFNVINWGAAALSGWRPTGLKS